MGPYTLGKYGYKMGPYTLGKYGYKMGTYIPTRKTRSINSMKNGKDRSISFKKI